MTVVDPQRPALLDPEAIRTMLPAGDPKRRGASWNPLWYFFGPTFQREMLVTGRKRGTYSTRLFYTIAVLGLLAFVVYGSVQGAQAGGAGGAQTYQTLPPLFALIALWYQYVLLTLMAPSMTSGSVCDERRARTLPSLMTTPLPVTEMILGRFTSRMLLVTILGLIVAPVLIGVRLFGGLDLDAVGRMLVITLSSVGLAVALGLLCSVHAKRSSSAATQGVLLHGIITFAPLLIILALNFGRQRAGEPLIPGGTYYDLCAPAQMVALSIDLMGSGRIDPALTSQGWTTATLYNIGWTALALALACVRFRKLMTSEKTFEAVVETKAERRKRRRKKGMAGRATARSGASGGAADALTPEAPAGDTIATDQASADGAPEAGVGPVGAPVGAGDGAANGTQEPVELRYADGSRVISDRPLLWREIRQPVFSTSRMLLITSLSVIVLGMIAYWWFGLDSYTFSFLIAGASVLGMINQVANQTTGVIVAEKESGTWETLLTTPTGPREILYAKAIGGLRQLWVIPAILMAHFVVMTLWGGVRPIFLLHAACIVVLCAGALTGTGVLLALVSKRSVQASMANFGIAAIVWMVLPVGVTVLRAAVFNAPVTNFWTRALAVFGEFLAFINPFLLMSKAYNGAVTAKMDAPPQMTGNAYQLGLWNRVVGGTPNAVEFTLILIGLAVASVALGLLALEFARRSFNKATGRPS